MSRKFLFLLISIITFGGGNFLHSQSIIDSLKRVLKSTSDPIKQMGLYSELGGQFYVKSSDSALLYTNKGIVISESVLKENKDSSYYDNLSSLLNNAAFINQKQGNYYDAIFLYQQSINAFPNSKFDFYSLTAKLNLGTLYYDIGEYDLAMKSLEKFRKDLGHADDVALANCLITIGSINVIRGNYDVGLNNYYSAMATYKLQNHYSGQGKAYNKIGEVYLLKRDYAQAQENFTKALFFYAKAESLRGSSESNYFIANLKFKQGDIDSAKYFAMQSLEQATKINFPSSLRDASKLLYGIYSKEKNYQKALEMHLLFSKMDSILSGQEAIKITAKEQLKNDFETKALLLKNEQIKKDEINQEALKRQKLISIVTTSGGVLFLLFLLIAIRSYRNKKKANTEISIQKKVVESKNKEILDSINYANRIQRTLLAHEDLLKAYLQDYFILFRPKDIVSGDFYWAINSNNSFYLAICDSTGHGVPGAFMSLLNISYLNEAINEKNISDPGKIFDHTRQRLIDGVSKEGAQDGMDGILYRFDLKQKQMSYSSANNYPLIIRDKTILKLNGDKMPIGKSPKENIPFSTHQVQLETGDLVIGFTDGLADQFGGPQGKKMKNKFIENFLLEKCDLPMESLKSEIQNLFENWKGNLEQVDDVLFFCLKVS